MRLALSPRAALDLEEIGEYIARDNPLRAKTFVREIRNQCRKAAKLPRSFPAREDIRPGVRMALHGRYVILFRIVAKRVRVERIVHGARNLRVFNLSDPA